MRTNLEGYLRAQALLGGGGFPGFIPTETPRDDQWVRGGGSAGSHALLEQMNGLDPEARPTPSNLAGLMRMAADPRDGGPDTELKRLAHEVMEAVDAGIESGVQSQWRKKKYRAVLTQASTKIAQDAVKKLTAEMESGRPITRDRIRSAVAEAVADVIQSVPSIFRKENVLGFGLFAVGLTLSGFANVELMSLANDSSMGTKLAIQGVIGTCMGYLLAIFNPYFNDKMSNQSRALNYKILNGMMGLLGEKRSEREQAQAVESSIQAQLGEVYIAQQGLDGRLQGVLGLMIGFCTFIGDSFFKARYILDDESNPNRMKDACDLMAGIFVTSRLVFYALKPEMKELFDAYIFSVLEPTLRKHASEHGQQMFDMIMAKIRTSKPTPSEETLKKYYEPFVRGALGLDQPASDRDLMSEVNDILHAREAEG